LFILAVGIRVEQDIFLSVQHNLAFVVEIDLNQFVVQSEHYCLLGFDPLFNKNKRNTLSFNRSGISSSTLQIFSKILHQR